MECNACGGKMMRRKATAKNPYHYSFCGLPNVYLRGITVCVCEDCKGESPIIPALGRLHRVISHNVSTKPGRLTGTEIRFLRKGIGLSSKKLAAVFAISPETLSRKENSTSGKLLSASEESLVRLMARRAAGSEKMREMVLELADLLGEELPKRPRRMCLKPDTQGGWKEAA